MRKLKFVIGFVGWLGIILSVACSGSETHKFAGKLATKVKQVSDYSEVVSAEDDVEISVVKKSDKEATLIVKDLKPGNNKPQLILETCNLVMTLDSVEEWRVTPTKCKTDKSEIEIMGTVSLKDKKMLLQLSGDFVTLKYFWRFEDKEIK